MERRKFNTILVPAALVAGAGSRAGAGQPAMRKEPKPIQLRRNGWMPNNERLPVLVYEQAIAMEGTDPAGSFERMFATNGWPPQWRDGVYDFHHYHSTAHEVLGIAIGEARLMLGGENGHELVVRAGDVLLLPAGTGHCKLESNAEFLVVGAYPPDQHWDICRSAPAAEISARMQTLPFPETDPVHGAGIPLTTWWKAR